MTVAVSTVDWLLESDEPGIVAQATRDLLDEHAPAGATRRARGTEGPRAAGQPLGNSSRVRVGPRTGRTR